KSNKDSHDTYTSETVVTTKQQTISLHDALPNSNTGLTARRSIESKRVKNAGSQNWVTRLGMGFSFFRADSIICFNTCQSSTRLSARWIAPSSEMPWLSKD